ncbi:MAG: hypothetical protein F6J90_13275 [Moorea sp. SIOASIH]|nr:hypothetical protein [Moorena sp. SIOASIH]NEO37237.1 hypothetical protein [Moorena sp. SIOASIH]
MKPFDPEVKNLPLLPAPYSLNPPTKYLTELVNSIKTLLEEVEKYWY